MIGSAAKHFRLHPHEVKWGLTWVDLVMYLNTTMPVFEETGKKDRETEDRSEVKRDLSFEEASKLLGL